MSGARGYEARCGLGGESTWGTAVACTELFKFSSENLLESSEPLADDAITGRASRSFERPGPIRVGGQLDGKLRYPLATGLLPSLLLKHAFGSEVGTLYRNVTNESFVPLRIAAADNVELAQQITAPGTGSKTVSSVRVLLRRVGALSAGNVGLEIRADSTGDPGTVITNGTATAVAVNTITTNTFGQWVTFTFAVAPTVTGATIYHLVLTGTYTESATDNLEVGTEDVASAGGFEIKDAAWANTTTKNLNARWYTSTFSDTFLFANGLTGLGLTAALDKTSGGVHEFTGLKVSKLTLNGDPDRGVMLQADLIGKQRSSSPTNTAGILAGLLNTRPPVGFTDLNFRIGDQADVLAAGDELAIRDFEYTQSWDLDQVNTSGGRTVIEPENAHRTVDFSFLVPRFTTSQYHTWAQAGTRLQARLQWTDGSNYLTLNIPELLLQPAVEAPVSGPQPLTVRVKGRCYQNTANSVMNIEDEAELTLTNV